MRVKAIAFCAAMLALSGPAFAADSPFYGTWKLNLAKSKLTNPALGKPRLIVLAPYGDNGWTRVMIDIEDPMKSNREEHYSASFDGKDYPTRGGDQRVISLKRIDDRTVETTTKRDGKVTSHTRITVSADGKTLTSTGGGQNGRGVAYADQVQVYERE